MIKNMYLEEECYMSNSSVQARQWEPQALRPS